MHVWAKHMEHNQAEMPLSKLHCRIRHTHMNAASAAVSSLQSAKSKTGSAGDDKCCEYRFLTNTSSVRF